jgi:hypothetical protein
LKNFRRLRHNLLPFFRYEDDNAVISSALAVSQSDSQLLRQKAGYFSTRGAAKSVALTASLHSTDERAVLVR